MSLLSDAGVDLVFHYAPLHYLPFIARSSKLLSKPALRDAGFGADHCRSKSSRSDVARGFGKYAFLTIDLHPRILDAKLKAGFPHFGIAVPSSAIDNVDYALSRFNVAMTRRLRRDNMPGWQASSTNGRYYGNQQIPVAKNESDKRELLNVHLNRSMIEVLIENEFTLPDDTKIVVYSDADVILAQDCLNKIKIGWQIEKKSPPSNYGHNKKHRDNVDAFIKKALSDETWRGNGLEFDRV